MTPNIRIILENLIIAPSILELESAIEIYPMLQFVPHDCSLFLKDSF
jgi:hypothetical protein